MNWNQGISGKATIRTALGGLRSSGSAASGNKPVASDTELVPSGESSNVLVLDDESTSRKSADSQVVEQQIQDSVAVNNKSEQVTANERYSDSPVSEGHNDLQADETVQEYRDNSTKRETPIHVDDDGDVLNLANQENSDAEIREPSEPIEHKLDTPTDEPVVNREDENTNTSGELQGSPEDQTDAMMDYSSSEQPVRERKETQAVEPPKTLADLDVEDLRKQLRYFYIARDPHTVPDTDPVHCLVCAKPGHMAGDCLSLTCSTCGAHKEHFAHSCPQTRRCDRCAERGHDVSNCPYKLKPPNIKIVCDLCKFSGHFEIDCELRWRTSGRPWETTLPALTVLRCCYECGASGHLGNDCPTRMPGKPMGTSTWSEHGLPTSITAARRLASSIPKNPPTKSIPPRGNLPKGPTVIKGRAQQQQQQSHKLPPRPAPSQNRDNIITISSSEDDERTTFLRPRVANATSANKMRIATETMTSMGPSGQPPRAQQDQRDARSSDYRDRDDYRNDYRDDYRGDYRGGRGGGGDFYRGGEGRRRSRSRSPLRRDDRRDNRPRFDAYRPMPSAGERAWKRGRM